MDHILEQHMAGQPFVNAASNVTYLRQLLHQQALSFTIILAAGNRALLSSVMGPLPATAPEAMFTGPEANVIRIHAD
jgi:hypothetical protein